MIRLLHEITVFLGAEVNKDKVFQMSVIELVSSYKSLRPFTVLNVNKIHNLDTVNR